MRSTLFFASGLLLAAIDLSSATLRVEHPTIATWSQEAISRKCGGPDRLACTSVETQLISSCTADGANWHPVSTARLAPHVFTSSATLLAHEYLHIADIGQALKNRAAEIERHQFPSQESCMTFLVSTNATMARSLLSIEEDSAHKRDPHTVSAATPLAESVAQESKGMLPLE